jgi:hypothetical protein
MATEVHVGGRLEAVAPRRVTDSGDRLRLLALLAVGALVHVWVVAHTSVTARDSIGFARIALQLENPHASGLHDLTEVLKTAHHPPGYPLAVLAASEVVRPAYPAPLPDQMLLSAQVASAIAGVLLLFPTYWLGRMLFGKFAGFAAALLVEVLPVPAEHTSDGLTEGLYLLGLGTALLLGVRAIRKPGVGGFLLCGLAIGATYLVRPEGILPAVAVGLVAVGMAFTRRWPWSLTAGRLAALGVGVPITSLPYMVLIGGVTNKPSGAGILPGFLSPKQLIHEPHGAVTSPALFADWYVPEADGPKYAWVPRAMAQESAKAFHYAPALLALVGLVVAARRLRAEPSLWVLILFAGMMLAVLTVLAYVGQRNPADAEAERRSYLSDRHTLSVVYIGLIFAGAGLVYLPTLLGRLPGVGRWLGRPIVAPIVLALIVISCVPPLLKSLH